MAKGLELAGMEHLALVERDSDACGTLRMNYNSDIVFQYDVRDFSFSDYKGKGVDVIAGGPPCQPFSLGGKSKGDRDARDMFPAAIAAVRTLMPKAFVFENVKGLMRGSFAEYFDFIMLRLTYPEAPLKYDNWMDDLTMLRIVAKSDCFDGLRYNVTCNLVNAADYGVPQKRERIIFVGFRSDLNVHWSFPKRTHGEESLLWSKYVTGDYWRRHNMENPYGEGIRKSVHDKLAKRCSPHSPGLKPWCTIRDAFAGLGEPGDFGEHSFRKGAKVYPGHTGSDIDEPSKTVKAGVHGVPGGENMVRFPDGTVRYMSVLEAKRIQTFPDEYAIGGPWSEAMRQLGNAVPVRLARVIGESVVKSITGQ